MKKRIHIFLSTLLLLSISWQCGAKSYIYISFKYNQDKIAAELCVNKEKPQSCCEGKCYLEKEIKQEDKRQSEFPSSLKDKSEKTELTTDFISFVFLSFELTTEHHFYYIQKPLNTICSFVFHPPNA